MRLVRSTGPGDDDVRWVSPHQNLSRPHPTLDSSRVFAVDGTGAMRAVARANGREAWRTQLAQRRSLTYRLISARGMVVAGTNALVFGGEEEDIAESNQQMLLVVSLAIFVVFVVLAVQYESLLDPLVILLAIPLALIGVMIALWVTDSTLSAPVFLGMIMLAGIVVNNSILLVEFIEHYRHERDVPMEEAVVEAGAVRMRPILMTTVTSIMGSLPLALGLGAGGELMRPLAIAVVGGLICSTLLTLFVVPCAYVLIQRGGERVKVFLVGSRKAAAPGGEVVEGAGD